ncbi:rubrerythrin-like domain-containing protein [Natrarchaeobaculum aegyptiacum]|nr:rubrerythrin-like domain-containing protein [Natrarchaeobaculum aegyptiacum]
MLRFDPYTPSQSYYECTRCGYREPAEQLPKCPDCGGRTRNIAVARE